MGTTVHMGAFLSTVGLGAVLVLAAALAWRGRFWWPVLLAAAVSLAVRLPQSPVPVFNIDEAINAAIAIRLQEGAVLYGGAWDHKPPLSFYLYKLIFDCFGPWNMTAVHVAGALLYAAAIILTGLVGRRLLPRAIAPWAAMLLAPYGLLYHRYDFMATNHELGGLPFLLLCVILFWKGIETPAGAGPADSPWHRRFRRWIWLAAAGGAGMVGGLFREACATIVPVTCLFLLLRPWLRGGSVRAALIDAAVFGAGAVVPLAIFVAWLFAHGVAQDAFYLMIPHNLRYRAAGRHGLDWLSHAVTTLGSLFLYGPALWLSVLVGLPALAGRVVGMLLRRIPAEPKAIYLALWCLGAGYMVGQGGRFHGHYFVPFYPPLMLATAGFLGVLSWPQRWVKGRAPLAGPASERRSSRASLPERGRQRREAASRPLASVDRAAPAVSTPWPTSARLLGQILLTAVLVLSVWPYYRYQAPNHARCVERFMLGREDVGVGFQDIMIDRDHEAVASVMQSMSGPGEPVFVWGFCPQLYVLAHRRSATRFTFTAILSGQTVEGRMIRTEPRSWELLRADLEKERPVLILDASSLFLKDQPLEAYPDFRAWLMQRYRPVVEVQGCRFYERNDRKPSELIP